MANENTPAWPQTTSGETDWEAVFEDPQTGFIALIVQARTPAALRKSTTLVINSIYTHDNAPPEIEGFASELEKMLPDDLPADALPKVTTAIITVLREIKDERIRHREPDIDFDGIDGLDDLDEEDKPKKKRWWNRKKKAKKLKKTRKKGKKPSGKSKKGKARKAILIVMGIILLLSLTGGGIYYYFFAERKPGFSELTRTLIDQMTMASQGNGPDHHVFGWALTVNNRAGLTGVTAEGVPAEACASAAWYFVNRGNVLINDKMPEKIAPNVLKRFCEEKGQRAKLTWLSKQSPAPDEEE